MGEEETTTLDDAVREGETEVGSEELLDVGTTDIDGLLDLSNAEDLFKIKRSDSSKNVTGLGERRT